MIEVSLKKVSKKFGEMKGRSIFDPSTRPKKLRKMYKITAAAPTAYQVNSLSSFGMGYKKNGNGTFSASKEFDTEEEAKEYLTSRAEKYNDEDPSGSEARLADMKADIANGSLRIDAVTAYIEESES